MGLCWMYSLRSLLRVLKVGQGEMAVALRHLELKQLATPEKQKTGSKCPHTHRERCLSYGGVHLVIQADKPKGLRSGTEIEDSC